MASEVTLPIGILDVLKNAAAYTRQEVLAAAQALIAFAASVEQEFIKGDLVIPADFLKQIETYIEQGLSTHLPAWLVTLAMDLLNQYLIPAVPLPAPVPFEPGV